MAIWHNPTIDLQALNALGQGSLPGHLGIEFTAAGETWLKARMPVHARTRQPWGRLHGGASVALAETVASVAAALTLDPAESAAVGLEVNANHVRPASDGLVHVEVTAENIGRTTQIWSFRIVDDADRLVCIGRITLAVIPASAVRADAKTQTKQAHITVTRPQSRFGQFFEALVEGFG